MTLFSFPNYVNWNKFDFIVLGAGISGIVLSHVLAQHGKSVLLLEKRNQLGGNCYDKLDETTGLLFHQYGPHIFHTDNQKVMDFIQPFFELNNYQHLVGLQLDNNLDLTLPFDFSQMRKLLDTKTASSLINFFQQHFPAEKHLTLMQLQTINFAPVQQLYQFLKIKVYGPYSVKMWGMPLEQIDSSVLGRVKISLSENSSYFPTATIQGLPKGGYTKAFTKMVDHPLIDLRLNCPANLISVNNNQLLFANQPITKPVVYCGLIDQLFGYCFGRLQYRSLHFEWKRYAVKQHQAYPVMNWPLHPTITRQVEYKQLTQEGLESNQTIVSCETPGAFREGDPRFMEPYYPLNDVSNNALFARYLKLANAIPNIHLLGRLALYQYIDMDRAIAQSLAKAEQLLQ